MRRVLWWLVGGSRGGRNRLRIIRTLEETPMNANQLSKALELDYKTTQHHLELLVENNVLMTMGEDYGKMYFLTDAMEQNLDVLDEVARQADLEPVGESKDAMDGEDHGG
jgi:DNA-binding transcriptional ArsR family regulator